MMRILLVDDDEQLGEPLAAYFARFEIQLSHATRPSAGLALLRQGGFDAAILDVMLPEMDGFALCRTIRKESEIPLIMLTARGDVMDRVVGLELGADDYLPKPFEPRELVARLQTVMRRRQPAVAAACITAQDGRLHFEGLCVDPATRTVQCLGAAVELTSTEFDLLHLLAREPGRVFNRDDILNQLRGHDAELYTRAVDIVVSRLRKKLEPLDDIRAGAQRFGSGGFGEPIPIRRRDELGQLASDVNAMATSIHQMLDAKRGLLLAISHELRSPLTRARLNTELLPETGDVAPRREALLRDLGEMRDLVTDLLETERLGRGHAALHLEAVDLRALAQEVVDGHRVLVNSDTVLPLLQLDRTRVRLMLRNLLDNALRHSAGVDQMPRLSMLHRVDANSARICITVRDFGPGVAESALPHLAEPFFRPDTARDRADGGVGLGLYLCKLVAQAHGGTLAVANAHPGLEVTVMLTTELVRP